MDNAQLWVEMNGALIIARIRGVPTEELLRECQNRVLQLVRDTSRARVLYDALELELPTVRLAFGEGDYRVFYNDISGAIHWLELKS